MSVLIEKEYKTPDGTIITEEEGRDQFGDDFDAYVEQGQ